MVLGSGPARPANRPTQGFVSWVGSGASGRYAPGCPRLGLLLFGGRLGHLLFGSRLGHLLFCRLLSGLAKPLGAIARGVQVVLELLALGLTEQPVRARRRPVMYRRKLRWRLRTRRDLVGQAPDHGRDTVGEMAGAAR